MEYQKKKYLVWLLFFSCIASFVYFLKTEAPPVTQLRSADQLDSLITVTFNQHQLTPGRVRIRTVEIDSLFSRRIYTVNAPPGFSATSFHYSLNQNILPYQAKTAAQVQFPERNVRIHVLVNDKVHRSVFIQSE